MLEKFFELNKNNTTPLKEIIAGITTFLSMSYIFFFQPALLSITGMDCDSVLVATVLGSAFATLIMALYARYPIALAPGMGINAFFVFTICSIPGVDWRIALGAVFISGMLFVLLSFVGFREKLIEAIPGCIKFAIPAGIGMFITLIGLEMGGIVVSHPATYIELTDDFSHPAVIICLIGLFSTMVLLTLKVNGGLLIGILISAICAYFIGVVEFNGFIDMPPSLDPTFLELDILGALRLDLIAVIFVLFLVDLFDTVGSLIGVTSRAGLMKNGKIERSKQALMADAAGTSLGALLGTSTITSYIESITGINVGGRTGLTAVVTAVFMLLMLFFAPLVSLIGQSVDGPNGSSLYPIIAPALIIVGSYMILSIQKINWQEYTESIPAFFTMVMMPFCYSITEGISFGFISYALLKTVSGKSKEVHWVVYLFAVIFILHYVYQSIQDWIF